MYLSVCLSTCLSVYLPIWLSDYLTICLSDYLSIFLSFYLPIWLSIYLPIYLSIYLSVCLSICRSTYLSFYLSIYVSIFLYLSIDRSIYLTIHLSERKQLCETSFTSRIWQAQNEAMLRDFFEKWMLTAPKRRNSVRLASKIKSWVQSWRPRTNAFCVFSAPWVLKYCACHEKVMPGHTKCRTCHANSS